MPLLFTLPFIFAQALLISQLTEKTHRLLKKNHGLYFKDKSAKVWRAAFMGTAGERRERSECTWKPDLLLHKLAPNWRCRRGQTQASRLTTCLEIRNSHWEIRVTRRPGERLLICSSTSSASYQNSPSLHPLGVRLMHDESAVCSMRFSHVGLNSQPPFQPWSKNTPCCW